MKKAFTMIELVFVIVILGILASIAVSKMAVTRDDAMFVKGKSQVAAIRNALTLVRNTNMLQARGSDWPEALDDAAANTSGAEIFDGNGTIGQLLDYPLYSTNKNGYWQKTGTNRYSFKVMNVDVNFTYAGVGSGRFQCTQGAVNTTVLKEKYCQILTR
jgi:general secretion pathway protein G